jgi:hypothetical protein
MAGVVNGVNWEVPADVPPELQDVWKEGERAGRTRDYAKGYMGEIARLKNQVALKMGKPGIVEAAAALRDAQKKQTVYERGFRCGQTKRERLKGGL